MHSANMQLRCVYGQISLIVRDNQMEEAERLCPLFPMQSLDTAPTTTEQYCAFALLYESVMIVEGGYKREIIYDDQLSEKAFAQVKFPRGLFAFEEFQEEHGFYSAHDPNRYNKKDRDYFVRLLVRMQRLGRYVPNFVDDLRLFPRNTATLQTQLIKKAQKSQHF